MSYTRTWDNTRPAGSLRVKQIDDEVRYLRVDLDERLADMFGIDLTDDPVVITKVGEKIEINTSQVRQAYTDLGNITGATALDFDVTGNIIFGTLTGNITISVSNMRVGSVYILMLAQDATGSRTVTLPAGLRTVGGASLTINGTANRVSLIQIIPYTASVGLVVLGGTNFNVS